MTQSIQCDGHEWQFSQTHKIPLAALAVAQIQYFMIMIMQMHVLDTFGLSGTDIESDIERNGELHFEMLIPLGRTHYHKRMK